MELPFEEIPAAQEQYTSGNMVKRMVDGLGYRYYWATEGLRFEDFEFSPSADSRNVRQTLEHLFGLSDMIVKAAKNAPIIRPADDTGMSFEELREGTLHNLKDASDLYQGQSAEEISRLEVLFESQGGRRAFPFWQMLNGPIADALYHTGQIVSYRRVSGNPMNPKVNVFMGRNNE